MLKSYKVKFKDKIKFKEQEVKSASTVFINKPIETVSDDLVGFDVQVKSIKEAINKGANSIGVISDYGTGKSSLTELISLEDELYCKPIKINLWDCLNDISNIKREKLEDTPIKVLTKSFLFQLASRERQLAKHINKRLSKNYGTLSFSITSNAFWLWLTGAALLYCIFMILGLLPTTFKTQELLSNSADFMWLIEIGIYIRPAFLILSLACAILGVRNTDIAFSLWDSQGKRNPEINDVFDIYLCIIEKISKKIKNKKQLIIIEDLDRVDQKEVAVNFLREIYRFNNLLSSELKKQFVFIVSVKPEFLLHGGKRTDELYPKIFDYTINLKPIHNEDYKSIVLKMLEQNKMAIQSLTGLEFQKDELPTEFEWILTGSNLTVRDLKQRLNHGLVLYEILKGKLQNETAAVELRRCMAVSYLESAYPKEYYELITNENAFSEIVEYTYKIKNNLEYINYPDSEKEKLVSEKIVELYKGQSTDQEFSPFFNEISRMLLRGIIDNDFRMYFYSYPKGSYVKNTDEKTISNLIELPVSNKKMENLNNIIARMGTKADRTISQSYSSLMKRELPLPKIIFENEKMFAIAADYHLDETVSLMLGQLKWNAQNLESTTLVFSNLNKYNFNNKARLFEEYTDKVIPEQISAMQESDICKMRLALIDSTEENIVYCRNLFVGDGMPIISKDEMCSNISVSAKLKLIKANLITTNNITYIYEVLNSKKLSDEDYKVQDELYCKITENDIDNTILSNISINLLTINNRVDDWIFDLITESNIKNQTPSHIQITNYLSVIDTKNLSLEYLNNIDKLMISDNVSEDVLQQLANNNLYHTYLLCIVQQNGLSDVEFGDANVQKNILEAMVALNSRDIASTIAIRSFILHNDFELVENYTSLFLGEYPLITMDELKIFKCLEKAMPYIDFSNLVTEDQANMLSEYINTMDLTQAEKISFLNLFTGSIADEIIIAKIFETLNFDKFNFKSIPAEGLEDFVRNVSVALRLNEGGNSLELMRKMDVLLESLEQIVFSNGLQTGTVPIESYVQLINDIAKPTKQTLSILGKYEIAWGLTKNITSEMFANGLITQSIIGETLWNKKFEFIKDKVDFSCYLNLYCDNRYIFEFMANNQAFLSYIIDNEKYKDFPSGISPSKLAPFYSCEQTLDFIKYLFGILDDTQKKEYLISFKSLKTREDSIAFSKFMLEDANHPFLKVESDFYKIREKLWEDAPTHKRQFTTARNKLYPKNQLDAVLL